MLRVQHTYLGRQVHQSGGFAACDGLPRVCASHRTAHHRAAPVLRAPPAQFWPNPGGRVLFVPRGGTVARICTPALGPLLSKLQLGR